MSYHNSYLEMDEIIKIHIKIIRKTGQISLLLLLLWLTKDLCQGLGEGWVFAKIYFSNKMGTVNLYLTCIVKIPLHQAVRQEKTKDDAYNDFMREMKDLL